MTAMKAFRTGLAALVVTGLVAGCAADAGDTDPRLAGLERSSVVIETANAERHRFDVFLATTPEQRAAGLMHVRKLRADAGMLFLFPESRPLSFWMKNTPLPLDILFVDSGGRVVNIAHDTVPGSLESVRSLGRARAVLELNAGTAKRLGIAAGATLEHPFFDPREVR